MKRHWCCERWKAGGEGNDRGWDGWMASLTQWTGIWAQEDSEEQGSLVCYRSWGCKQPGTTYNWTTTIQFEFTFEKYSVTPLVFQIKAGYISRIISKNALCPQKITPGLWQWYFLPNIELPTLSNVPWEVLWNHHRTPKRDTSSENGVLNKSGHIHLAQWKIKQKNRIKKIGLQLEFVFHPLPQRAQQAVLSKRLLSFTRSVVFNCLWPYGI